MNADLVIDGVKMDKEECIEAFKKEILHIATQMKLVGLGRPIRIEKYSLVKLSNPKILKKIYDKPLFVYTDSTHYLLVTEKNRLAHLGIIKNGDILSTIEHDINEKPYFMMTNVYLALGRLGEILTMLREDFHYLSRFAIESYSGYKKRISKTF